VEILDLVSFPQQTLTSPLSASYDKTMAITGSKVSNLCKTFIFVANPASGLDDSGSFR